VPTELDGYEHPDGHGGELEKADVGESQKSTAPKMWISLSVSACGDE